MSKVLVVKGHPLEKEESRSMKGLTTFLETYQALHPEDECILLDLYKEEIPEVDARLLIGWKKLASGTPFHELEDNTQEKITRFNTLTEQFLDADKIVLAHPLWNLMIPSRVKSWFDTIAVAGKTFRYTADGPVGLATGKKVFHIQSNGGVYHYNDPASQYVKGMFQFLGITDITQVAIEGLDWDAAHAEELLSTALENIKKETAQF